MSARSMHCPKLCACWSGSSRPGDPRPPALVFDLAADELFPELKFIVSFADSDDADYASHFLDYFRLGPHGLQPFIDLPYGIYTVLFRPNVHGVSPVT
jgi:hypothetical protein